MRLHPAVSVLLGVVLGCDARLPPLEEAARAASEGRSADALAIYEAILAGEHEVSRAGTFEAFLESARCLAQVGRLRDGLDRFEAFCFRYEPLVREPGGQRYLLRFFDALEGPGWLTLEGELRSIMEKYFSGHGLPLDRILRGKTRLWGPFEVEEKLRRRQIAEENF